MDRRQVQRAINDLLDADDVVAEADHNSVGAQKQALVIAHDKRREAEAALLRAVRGNE